MIQKASMIGTAEDEQGDGDLRRAEDRQDGERVADEHHAARADEHGRRMEVPAQETEERAGKPKHRTAMNG